MKVENNILVKVTNEDLDDKGHFMCPEGITQIGDFAFSGCTQLKIVFIEGNEFGTTYSSLPPLLQETVKKYYTNWYLNAREAINGFFSFEDVPNQIKSYLPYLTNNSVGFFKEKSITLPDQTTQNESENTLSYPCKNPWWLVTFTLNPAVTATYGMQRKAPQCALIPGEGEGSMAFGFRCQE